MVVLAIGVEAGLDYTLSPCRKTKAAISGAYIVSQRWAGGGRRIGAGGSFPPHCAKILDKSYLRKRRFLLDLGSRV